MAEHGPERFGGESLTMPVYGVGPKRKPKKGRPLLSLLVFLALLAAAWWVAKNVFDVSFFELGFVLVREAANLLTAARELLGL